MGKNGTVISLLTVYKGSLCHFCFGLETIQVEKSPIKPVVNFIQLHTEDGHGQERVCQYGTQVDSEDSRCNNASDASTPNMHRSTHMIQTEHVRLLFRQPKCPYYISAGSSLVNHPSQPKCPYYISAGSSLVNHPNRYALITYQQAARWSTIQVNRNALITSAGSSLVNHPSQPKCPYYISRQLAGQPSKSTEMPLLHQQAARWSTIQVNRSDGFQP